MSSATLTIDNEKNFEQQVKLITQIESLKNTSIKLVDISNTNAILNKKGLDFNLKTDNHLEIKSNENFKEIEFILNNKKFVIFKDSFGSQSKSTNIDSNINLSATYEILGLQSIGFERTSTYHSFYPVELKDCKTFHNEFKTVTYQSKGTEYFYDCIRIELDNKQFDITQFKTDKKGYYVVQSFNNETFEEFNEYCFIIRQAIGFVNGFFVGNEEYIFSGNQEMCYSNYIRPSIKGMYNPIITNPYSRPDIERKTAEQLIGKLTRISSKTLSNLANKIRDNEELSVVIILLLESTSIHSLLIIPSIFSVIIESLSKIISIPETGLEYPIKYDNLKKEIIDNLISIIDSNSDSLGLKSSIKLKQRISAINNPINKRHLTNNEKLIQPFNQLNINLTEQDNLIIEHRNDLLHGNILFKDKKNVGSEKSTDAYMAYVSAKQFTLISKLILKYVGYNGYVYNQSKYLEKHLKIETNEEYFETI